ncbi:hypothetical protein SAMN05421869_1482 [Nonomuraea jiangxiensis]|uniref:Uncharacterized protein n=1 Tax=Nonomuraea jiangxiensis TaxID=633440 RepID=A0A1G9UBV1_9ACTN|nr:hypothetical protein SAMN05421869_1482 [Nonomuraea jiangxiensis]
MQSTLIGAGHENRRIAVPSLLASDARPTTAETLPNAAST